MLNKDRVLRMASGTHRRMLWFHHMDVNTNLPRLTRTRAQALRIDAETAEKIRFNLTARGWHVRVEFDR